MRMIFPAWFYHLKERFFYKEIKFNESNLPVITDCLRAENVMKPLVIVCCTGSLQEFKNKKTNDRPTLVCHIVIVL